MANITNLISLDNPVFCSFLFYSCILVLKMLLLAPLTAIQRLTKRVFSSPEDTALLPKSKVKYDDPDVERVRRAHLNDLENIPVFMTAAFAYIMTNPTPWLAVNLFRAFTAARVTHTLVYAVVVVPQPARALAFFVGYGVTAYMAAMSILHFLSFA